MVMGREAKCCRGAVLVGKDAITKGTCFFQVLYKNHVNF